MNPELSYASQPANDEPEPTPKGFFSRLTGVYFSPGETFQEIGRAPRVVVPIIATVLLTLVTVFVVFQRLPFDKITDRRLEQAVESGRITQEQANQQREQMNKFAPVMKAVIPFAAAIFSVVLVLGIAGVMKLISSMMGIENKFLSLFAATLYAMLAVSVVGAVVTILLLYLKPVDDIDPTNPVGSNLAAWLSMAGVTGLPKFISALFAYVDVFYIWKVVLIAIGWAAVSRKLKTSTAMVYATVGALLLALIGAGWTAMFS